MRIAWGCDAVGLASSILLATLIPSLMPQSRLENVAELGDASFDIFNNVTEIELTRGKLIPDFGNGMKYGNLARTMPCCGESVGTHACIELRNR